MNAIDLAQRLVDGLRSTETSPYHIERPMFETFGDLLYWLREVEARSNDHRETFAKRLIFQRWWRRRALAERGVTP